MWRKYFTYAQIFWIGANVMDANISWVQTFHGRKHSWAQTFHGRKHFMGANISWARIFHGREYFEMCAYILIGSKYLCVNCYFRQAPLFNDFAVSSAQFLQWVLSVFAISFALILAANICVYFQYLFMHVVCANIFGANVLKSRFKIDVVIRVIICSIVIIINSVLTLQVSTAKYPMIADLAK